MFHFMPSEAEVRKALNTIIDPVSQKGLSEAGLVMGLVITKGRIGFMLEVPHDLATTYGPVRLAAEKCLMGLKNVTKAQVVLTAQTAPPAAPKSARLSPQALDQARARAPVASQRPDHVKRVLVVGSGKGGVGKSTLSLGLALGFQALGLRVGFLDADIYGPSAPTLCGLGRPPGFNDDKQMVPPKAFGLKVNSVGFLVDADQAMIWRGPMASQALTQLLTQTEWGTKDEPLDVLVIDLPPGTGDVHLTLMQRTLIDGAIIVTTPSDMALVDARRAATLFEKTSVPIIGLIENMAYFVSPDGAEHAIFGRGGGRTLATGLGVDFMGEVPLDPRLRQGNDEANPLSLAEPSGDMALRFEAMAQACLDKWHDKA